MPVKYLGSMQVNSLFCVCVDFYWDRKAVTTFREIWPPSLLQEITDFITVMLVCLCGRMYCAWVGRQLHLATFRCRIHYQI